jgi:quercetin dioxygenase-like cupin family protein
MSAASKDLGSPDRSMTFEHGKAEVVSLGEFTISRFTFEPGWRWSTSVKPIAKTESCQVHHVGYLMSGRLHVATEDGDEREIVAGDAYEIRPGHDGWVVGDQVVTSIEFSPAG